MLPDWLSVTGRTLDYDLCARQLEPYRWKNIGLDDAALNFEAELSGALEPLASDAIIAVWITEFLTKGWKRGKSRYGATEISISRVKDKSDGTFVPVDPAGLIVVKIGVNHLK